MARIAVVSLDDILETAFAMAREEGIDSVTARRVAAKAGCSTQPIFRVYANMEELQNAVYEKAIAYFRDFYARYPRNGKVPFSNLGMAYIAFAREDGNLFRLLFVDNRPGKKTMYEVLNGPAANVSQEINMAKNMGCTDPGDLFMKMWLFIHGAACMTLSGDYDLSDSDTMTLLEESYYSFATQK